MHRHRARSAFVFAILLSAIGRPALAEAPRSSYGQRSQTRPQTQSLRTNLGDVLYGYGFDPVTGEWITKHTATGSRPGGSTPPAEPSAKLPFDHFDADDDGSSIINSYLLSYLSFLVYSSEANVDAFEEELLEELLPQGVVDVHAFVHPYGTEGAIVFTDDAAIVVFRGTSSEGTEAWLSDYLTDANDTPQLVDVGGKSVYVHEGFWTAADDVYNEIREQVTEAHLDGREIWLTGHSLGAAVATLTAFRLHYEDGVSVQGLQTFGSPKVGDLAFALTAAGANGAEYALEDVTLRWVVDGDPVTTFFDKEMVGFNFWGPIWVYYEHVGVTHTIHALGGGAFDVQYDTGEDKTMGWNIGGLVNEHLWYPEALAFEMTAVLLDTGQDAVLEEIFP